MTAGARTVVCSAFFLATAAFIVEAQSIVNGRPAPKFDLPTLNGGRFELTKLRGHRVHAGLITRDELDAGIALILPPHK